MSAECVRCGREGPGLGWIAWFEQGVLQGVICPACKTLEEELGAEVNGAMLSLRRYVFGLAWASPKADLGADGDD